ncbi:hypothetical protein QO002_004620 [Pararhizobium capsulatum DSM 1112]|uniref:Cyclic di-GMP-binding protein n=1 Tax=Pararhizobium capsulatum DSM 1112 TaxID=1121113 RepID=A0ABU0BVX8_9HYPH|nr:cellulose biosynthesis cyclic di-GMP-binding regulatory protein BcsB [Pararhizobium capsulatum]MDQ0322414.1 hypothetical protein [Pararhizobium capsulatum DSM 1112]
MKRILAACFLLLTVTADADAQSLPFDMSTERPVQEMPAPLPDQPAAGAEGSGPTDAQPSDAQPAQDIPAETESFRRYMLPSKDLNLAGEVDQAAWTVYLTAEQAASATTFNIGYQNAILVAPETSRLTVSINDVELADEALRSAEGPSDLNLTVPKGLLKPGANLLRLRATQRHRTDCTIQSTYELWSNISGERTYLNFDGRAPSLLSTIDDVRAVGVDDKGLTQFNLVAPGIERPSATVPLLRLSQGLATLANMPNQSVTIEASAPAKDLPGRLTVLVGTADELQPLLPALPAEAGSGPIATFVNDARSGGSVLVVSGPTWEAVSSAIESIVAPSDAAPDSRRDVIATQRWMAPDVPFLFSGANIRLSQLGLKSENFPGRRFRTQFNLAVPADFYANAYGEAVLLLDAAYAQSVLPGSHIDIYVNGNIASTVPISATGGGILRHLPINVTLRHFRPGVNTITIEAILNTGEDKACAPGSTAADTPRFALFDTTEFHMPDFARIAQLPNLSAVAGTGFPYGRATAPVPLFMDRLDSDTLSAAATFLARIASGSGHPVPIETVASPSLIGNRDAIFVGTLSQMPPTVFTQLNIAATNQTIWGGSETDGGDEAETQVAFDEWRDKLPGGALSVQVTALEDWLKRNFDISLNSLRLTPAPEPRFSPARDASLIIAQGASPEEHGTWTVVAGRTGRELKDAMLAVSARENWTQITGHVASYQPDAKTIQTVPVAGFELVPTLPPSFANYRLIAANWLSSNILSYALLLAALAVILGLATAALLTNLGRRG